MMIILILLGFLYVPSAYAQNIVEVNSVDELLIVMKDARPGMEIMLSEKVHIRQNITLSGNGTKENPIVIRTKSRGETLVTADVKLQGDYVFLSGLTFTGENGNVVIEGRGCRLSQCTFSDSKARKWVRVRPGSSQIEIDHNLFENKTINQTEKGCQLMQIVVRNHNEQHHIHHNLFRNIPPGNGNGYETLQLITEGNPFDPPGGHSQTLIENNLFIRCNGEAEIISIKSNGNTIRRNNFRACKGGLVLRHGDDNLVTGNFFFGDGETGSGGVRLQGTGQEVAHNYFHELGQYGIAMMDGTPDDLYMRVERAEIVFNTFIRCRKDLVIGLNHSKHPNGTAPKDCRIVGNIFYESLNGSQEPFIEFVQGDEPVRWDWVDNLAFKKGDPPVIDGIRITDPHLKFKRKQLAIPSRRTLVVDILDQGKVTKDRSGNQLNGIKTTGAIQFPAKSWKKVLLTEQMVGPDAMEY